MFLGLQHIFTRVIKKVVNEKHYEMLMKGESALFIASITIATVSHSVTFEYNIILFSSNSRLLSNPTIDEYDVTITISV